MQRSLTMALLLAAGMMLVGDGYAQQTPAASTPAATTPSAPAATTPKAAPTASDSVKCNYRGTLINGKEFDSSYKRGQPATFAVGQVIKAWTEALELMPVGSKWQLFVPSDLAYGERGAGAEIGPNATLIFEVELLSIEDKAKDDKTKGDKPKDDKSEEKK